MTRVAAQIVVAVPADLCLHAVQESMNDPRLRDAYRALRPGKEYAGWVTRVEPGRRLEVAYAALDPLTDKRSHALGWRVQYDLAAEPDGRTRVEVAIEYGWLTAVGGMGLVKAQAENEVAQRLAFLHALELGLRQATTGTALVAAIAASDAVTQPALPAGAVPDAVPDAVLRARASEARR